MPRVGFEPTISAGERPKNYALDRAVAGIGYANEMSFKTVHMYYQFWSSPFQALQTKSCFSYLAFCCNSSLVNRTV